jgi:uncharacterized membrane protein YkgB
MASSRSSSSTVLLILILIFTFPFWIVAGGIVFGVLAAVIGAMFGVVAAIFGVLIAIVTLPFKIIFGWGDWGWHNHWPHFHGNGFITLAVIIVIALLIHKRKK